MTEKSTQQTAARERDRRLRDLFGWKLWNVASEPECRSVFRIDFVKGGSKRSRFIPVKG